MRVPEITTEVFGKVVLLIYDPPDFYNHEPVSVTCFADEWWATDFQEYAALRMMRVAMFRLMRHLSKHPADVQSWHKLTDMARGNHSEFAAVRFKFGHAYNVKPAPSDFDEGVAFSRYRCAIFEDPEIFYSHAVLKSQWFENNYGDTQ